MGDHHDIPSFEPDELGSQRRHLHHRRGRLRRGVHRRRRCLAGPQVTCRQSAETVETKTMLGNLIAVLWASPVVEAAVTHVLVKTGVRDQRGTTLP